MFGALVSPGTQSRLKMSTGSSNRTPPVPVPSALSALVKYTLLAPCGSNTTPSKPPVRKGGVAYGGRRWRNSCRATESASPPVRPTQTRESAFITATMYVGSDALTERLLKVSITESEPSGFSAMMFTLKWVWVGSELCLDAPIAIRFPHAPGFRAVKANPSRRASGTEDGYGGGCGARDADSAGGNSVAVRSPFQHVGSVCRCRRGSAGGRGGYDGSKRSIRRSPESCR